MLSKRKIKAFLSFNWFFILLIYIGSFVGFYYLFDALKTPQYNEKINIFIGINHLDSKNMEKDLYNNVKGKSIKAVDVDYSNPNDSYYSIIFNTRGLVNTDILILPESSIENSNYSTYFIELKDNIITKYASLICDFFKFFSFFLNFFYICYKMSCADSELIYRLALVNKLSFCLCYIHKYLQ